MFSTELKGCQIASKEQQGLQASQLHNISGCITSTTERVRINI